MATRDGAWVVAVDGPAGSGKSSICAEVAKDLGWSYVNTGMLYRALAYLLLHEGIDTADEAALRRFLEVFLRNFFWDLANKKILWKGKDISPLLSSVEVGNQSSLIAKIPLVRSHLLPLQRELARKAYPGILLDGRDIATVVCPDAHLKVFMTASLAVRAKRRLLQLKREGNQKELPTLARLIDDMAKRDAQDSKRSIAPLRKAHDAVELDTSELSFSQAVDGLKALITATITRLSSR